jgi:hypothetical protein
MQPSRRLENIAQKLCGSVNGGPRTVISSLMMHSHFSPVYLSDIYGNHAETLALDRAHQRFKGGFA